MSPLDAFKTWFKSQPEEIRRISVFILAGTLPIACTPAEQKQWMTEPEKSVETWLNEGSDIYMRTVGKVLTIRALVTYYIQRGVETPEDWHRREEFNNALAKRFEDEGYLETAQKVRLMTAAFQRLIPEWQQFSRSWRQLCSGALSDVAIAAWADQQILGQRS